jgi:DNA helicase-2/ATP-dependent DNA helicase PcrA
MEEFRIFGPPGTGKTTRLAKQSIPAAVDRYGENGVMVTSFTRAAALEIAGRGINVAKENVGTIHSLCYHAIGQPKVFVEVVKQWNEEHPTLTLSASTSAGVDASGAEDALNMTGETGDNAYNMHQVLRAKMVPKEYWPANIQRFDTMWTDFKEQTNCCDFTDLIERAIKERPFPPGQARCMIVDEAQDNTPLMLSLCRRWAASMDWLCLVGDDDQTIYRFTGANPRAFLHPPIPDERKVILDQSYRVPVKVHEIAQNLIRRIPDERREPKDYKPFSAIGVTNAISEPIDSPSLIERVDRDFSEGNQTVMILASCAYMLRPLVNQLREEGYAFHNPYRPRGEWNPLRSVKGTSTKDVVTAFLTRSADGTWNVPNLITWASAIRVCDTGVVRDTGKKALTVLKKAVKDGEKGLHSSKLVLDAVLTPIAQVKALEGDVAWFYDHLVKRRQSPARYVLDVYRRSGMEFLEGQPRIVVGTIHSVKGGEADSVILAPDLSYAGAREAYGSQEGMDAAIRLFYVGMTRAKRKLSMLQPMVKGGRIPTFMEL